MPTSSALLALPVQVSQAGTTFAGAALNSIKPQAQVEAVNGLLALTLLALSTTRPAPSPRANLVLQVVSLLLQAFAVACLITLMS